MAGAWNEGSWNDNSWGTDVNVVLVEGLSTSTSIGNSTAFPELGWGGGEYGEQAWNALQDNGIVAPSFSLTNSIGSVSIETLTDVQVDGFSLTANVGQAESDVLNNGWGARTWGFSVWGSVGDVILTGQQLTAATGQAIASIDVDVQTGSVSLSTDIGSSASRIDVEVLPDGVSSIFNIGNEDTTGNAIVVPSGATALAETGQATIDPTFLIGEGWGRDTYGNLGWGVNYSVIGGGANGIPISIVTGNEDAFTDVTVTVTTAGELQTAITPVGTSANSDNEIAHSFLLTQDLGTVSLEGHANVEVTGIAQSIVQGDAIGGTIQEVPVTGVSLSTFIGNENTAGNADVIPTGVSATGAVGDIVPVSSYDLTGATATYSVGQVTNTGSAVVIPTGVGLTTATGSPNIIAWAEVNTGTPVTWSEVDLAA